MLMAGQMDHDKDKSRQHVAESVARRPLDLCWALNS
jgi:hypothetical protein